MFFLGNLPNYSTFNRIVSEHGFWGKLAKLFHPQSVCVRACFFWETSLIIPPTIGLCQSMGFWGTSLVIPPTIGLYQSMGFWETS